MAKFECKGHALKILLHSKLNSSVIRNYAKLSAKEPMLINVNEAKKKT